MARYLSSTQWLRWTLSYPMLAWDTHLPNGFVGRQAEVHTGGNPFLDNPRVASSR